LRQVHGNARLWRRSIHGGCDLRWTAQTTFWLARRRAAPAYSTRTDWFREIALHSDDQVDSTASQLVDLVVTIVSLAEAAAPKAEVAGFPALMFKARDGYLDAVGDPVHPPKFSQTRRTR
jgi:hypothetical protein